MTESSGTLTESSETEPFHDHSTRISLNEKKNTTRIFHIELREKLHPHFYHKVTD